MKCRKKYILQRTLSVEFFVNNQLNFAHNRPLNVRKTSEREQILLFPLHLFSHIKAKMKPSILNFLNFFQGTIYSLKKYTIPVIPNSVQLLQATYLDSQRLPNTLVRRFLKHYTYRQTNNTKKHFPFY